MTIWRKPLALLLASSIAAVAAHPKPEPAPPAASFPRRHARDTAPLLQKRQNCGPGIGSCGGGMCCSQWGWCGNGAEYCVGCQPGYGSCPGGGGNPQPTPTPNPGGILGVPRPKFGSVPYGPHIVTCNTRGTIALTFDDGPYIYTSELLDLLARYNVKATFFINGNNWADASQAPYPGILRRMVAEGHQVASHGYRHQNLDSLDTNGRRQEMAQNEQLLKDVLGYFPTYMRPPYGACGGPCQADMAALGYHVIMWNIDTLDYNNNGQTAIQNSKNIFDGAVSGNAAGNAYISLEHDVHLWTVRSLAEHLVQTTLARGYRAVTVGECLGDSSGNWYRDGVTGQAVGGGSGGNPGGGNPGGGNPGGGQTPSPDGRCGNIGGTSFTCQGTVSGNCCSQWGWCGSTGEYCGAGCQSAFGSCS